MRKRILTLTATLVAGALATAGIYDSVTLKRVAKVGDVHSWKLTVDLDMQGTEVNLTADISEEVLKVNGDGSFTVSERTENQVVMVGGSEMPANEAPGVESTYAASGQILKIESAQMDADVYRFASLMNIMWPTRQVRADWVWTIDSGLSVSSSWTVKTDADSDKGTFDMTFSYKILGRETSHGFDCFKIKFENRETSGGGASSEGTVWIDVKTGLTVKVYGDMYGAPMMGMPIDAHFEVELTD